MNEEQIKWLRDNITLHIEREYLSPYCSQTILIIAVDGKEADRVIVGNI